ncbi:DsbA family protein [Rhodanobacter thiooxydans]|uniref:DsbA family protein n=1 Tax=Rhodanobacter thiooxydans TaxID=416169 RepID=UPI000260FC11|nr:thioredoxin domain-containing protein [Rhodanobacter thiooxydans]EIL97919.1 hypothetical protein UUA_13210 [Rhodanobacter thiooxydans LCS2]MCW0203063.1 thioredoxin domain-containing protein [Rhodanobacter thiooxydans]
MDARRVTSALIAVAMAVTLVTACSHKAPSKYDVEGQYELFNNVRAHSLDTVRLDVYEDFTCPACQQFANDFMPSLQSAYGERVTLHMHYLVGSKSPVSAQVLYQVAERHGLGDVAAQHLFAARLDHHSEDKNAPVVAKIASDLNLSSEYDAALRDPLTTRMIRAAWNEEGAKITFFPSIVVERVLLTNSNPENLNTIINSLLKKPMVQVSTKALPDGKVRVSTDQAAD